MTTEDGLRAFFAARGRVLATRASVPSTRPRFSRYHHHSIWHVCPYTQNLPFDSAEWIEVAW